MLKKFNYKITVIDGLLSEISPFLPIQVYNLSCKFTQGTKLSNMDGSKNFLVLSVSRKFKSQKMWLKRSMTNSLIFNLSIIHSVHMISFQGTGSLNPLQSFDTLCLKTLLIFDQNLLTRQKILGWQPENSTFTCLPSCSAKCDNFSN